MYLSDVIATIESGRLDYSPANRRKVLGSLRRTAALYGAPASTIPADPDRFTRHWGRGRVTTYPIEHFQSADQFVTWRSNVRGALAQASGAKAAGQARRATRDAWSEILAAFDAHAGAITHGHRFNRAQRPALERLVDYARRDGLAPGQLTREAIVHFRKTHCLTPGQTGSLTRGARIFDRLIEDLPELAPAAPIGRLPAMRVDTEGARMAAMPLAFRDAWQSWCDAYRAGTPSALSGSTRLKSKGYMGQFDAAIAWLLEGIDALGLVDLATVAHPRDLARPDWIAAAARTVAEAYDEDGDPVDDDVVPRLSLRSLQTYLLRLGTVFEDLDCSVAAGAIRRLLDDEKFRGLDGMTRANIAFCRTLVRSPSKQATLFGLPWALQARAQALLDRWDGLTIAERHTAVRAGTSAVAMLILLRCAPIRIGNLAAISFGGVRSWLTAPVKGERALLVIPASEVKNRREIRAPLQDDGRKGSWPLVAWYLDQIRPRGIALSSLPPEIADGAALFPGARGAASCSVLRDWMRIETAACGLPIRPHQTRHAIASILLNRNRGALAQVAALLGDRVSTVERAYAWIDQEALIADAQHLVPTVAAVLREVRRG